MRSIGSPLLAPLVCDNQANNLSWGTWVDPAKKRCCSRRPSARGSSKRRVDVDDLPRGNLAIKHVMYRWSNDGKKRVAEPSLIRYLCSLPAIGSHFGARFSADLNPAVGNAINGG